MEKRDSKGLWIALGIFIALLLLLAGMVVWLICGQGSSERENGNAGPFVIEESASDEETKPENTAAPVPEISEGNETGEKETEIVVGGYRFGIPSDYSCFYAEGIGPVIYTENRFQMRLGVRSDSYEEATENPDKLTEKTVAAGGKILQEVKEITIDGKSYSYFRMELGGEPCFVIYTASPEGDRTLAGQIAVISDELTDAELTDIFASVAVTAEVTEQPDSTSEDIAKQTEETGEHTPGKKKETSSLSFDNETVCFGVPEGFYSTGYSETDIYTEESFVSEDYAVMADCYLWSSGAEDSYYTSAEAYINVAWDSLYDNVKKEAEIRTMDIEGTNYFYIDAHYEMDGRECRHIYAACDIGTYGIYVVSASMVKDGAGLNMETLHDFFVFYSEDFMTDKIQ